MTLKIGLTGGIGAGKTTVAHIFERFGVPVFYADKEAKRILNENLWLKQEIISVFGTESYMNTTYNSRYIAEKVFNNPELLTSLNKMVHPLVHEAFSAWYNRHGEKPYVIEEAALLLESGGKSVFDHIIVVIAPMGIRIQRVSHRDGIDEDQILKRMNSQMKQEDMIRQADSLIVNGVNDLLIPRVLELHNKFVSLQNKINH